jgi:hypothetical protein
MTQLSPQSFQGSLMPQNMTPVPQSMRNQYLGGANNIGQGTGQTQSAPMESQMGGYQDMYADTYDTSGYDDQLKQAKRFQKEQEKALKKQYEALIRGLDPQYAQYQTEATGELDKAKQQDLLSLAGAFSFANSDPNDEQRAQYQTRTTQDYGNQLSALLNKIQQAKAQEIAQYQNQRAGATQDLRSNMYNQMQSIEEAKQTARMRAAEALQAARSRGGSAKSYGSTLDQIMADNGVDINTARLIYNKQFGLRNTSLEDAMAQLLGQQGGTQPTGNNPYEMY